MRGARKEPKTGKVCDMGITIRPSDLYYKYPKDVANRDKPKFTGKPDAEPFNRDDLYEVIPLLEAVMDALGTDDAAVLHRLEDIMIRELPRFITRRDEVFDCLVGAMRELLGEG